MFSQQLKDYYPMQSQDIFTSFPIIQQIANDTRWTVSNDQKVPLNANRLLDGVVEWANIYDDSKPLTDLATLDANENLVAVNRTYHLNATQNRIIMVDAEPEASAETLQQVLHFPSEYTEISTNGGVHLLIRVPEELITPENEYLFHLTVIKDNDRCVEFLFNNHFTTFTKKIVTDKPVACQTDQTYIKSVQQLLASIVEIDREKKAIRDALREQRKTLVDAENVNKALVMKITNLEGIQRLKRTLSKKSEADYNNDRSRYESGVATSYAFKTLEVLDNIQKSTKLSELFDAFDEEDTIYTVYSLLKDTVPYRDKHDTDRQGLPWLLMVARDSLAFARISKQKQKENARERKK